MSNKGEIKKKKKNNPNKRCLVSREINDAKEKLKKKCENTRQQIEAMEESIMKNTLFHLNLTFNTDHLVLMARIAQLFSKRTDKRTCVISVDELHNRVIAMKDFDQKFLFKIVFSCKKHGDMTLAGQLCYIGDPDETDFKAAAQCTRIQVGILESKYVRDFVNPENMLAFLNYTMKATKSPKKKEEEELPQLDMLQLDFLRIQILNFCRTTCTLIVANQNKHLSELSGEEWIETSLTPVSMDDIHFYISWVIGETKMFSNNQKTIIGMLNEKEEKHVPTQQQQEEDE
jgi:hypothetical protein